MAVIRPTGQGRMYVHELTIGPSTSTGGSGRPGKADEPSELSELGEPGAASMIASYGKVHSGWPGSVPFVSDRAGAYGWLLLATYECMKTYDWLMPVILGAWRAAPPISVVDHADVG